MDTASTARPPKPQRRHRSEEQRAADRARLARSAERAARVLLPLALVAALLVAWELLAPAQRARPAALPAPSQVLEALAQHADALAPAWWFTARVSALGLAAAALAGVLLAAGCAWSKWVEMAIRPIALALQLTPVVATAPLLLLQADAATTALVACVALVALYPILAHTRAALERTDAHLRDLYTLYGATAWQRLRLLLAPTALPGLLGGLRVAAGLAPAAALAAEFVAPWIATPAGAPLRPPGLVSQVLAALHNDDAAWLWAALALAALLALAFHGLAAALARLVLGPAAGAARPRAG
jgi:NitT/TauT family transport system permease protein